MSAISDQAELPDQSRLQALEQDFWQQATRPDTPERRAWLERVRQMPIDDPRTGPDQPLWLDGPVRDLACCVGACPNRATAALACEARSDHRLLPVCATHQARWQLLGIDKALAANFPINPAP